MKALTICQPYAELIARGDKPIENRTWPTNYRGPIVIHAGKSRDWLSGDQWEEALPFGAIVATADLVACLSLDPMERWPTRFVALANHEHANGPFCWILENIRRVEPIPYRGAQGLFDIPDSVLAAASSATEPGQ